MPDSRSETSSPGWSGGLSGALDVIWVQGLVRNLPFSHTREVISPSCQISKEGRGPDGPSSSLAASRVVFETTGLTLACAN